MARLPHRCVMISVCLAGALLLLPLCLGVEDDQYNFDYDPTQTPEYDYNSTFEYSFFSNTSSDELEKFLLGRETETETETVGGVHEEKPTEPTIFDTDQKKEIHAGLEQHEGISVNASMFPSYFGSDGSSAAQTTIADTLHITGPCYTI